MAARVNTVFVIVLCAGLIALVGGFAAVYVLVINKSAAQYQKIGDDLANQGELNRAATNYLKGINKDQDNYDLIRKYIQTAKVMPVQTNQRARQTLGNIQHLKYQATQYRRSDDQLLGEYYQMLIESAKKLGPGYYNRLYEQADARLDNDPSNLVARKYRGIAQTQRLTPDLPEEDIQQALDDLTVAREAQPEDAQVLYYIALWKLKEASRLDRPGGQPEKAKTLRKEAIDTARAMYQTDPQSPERSAYYLQILLNSQIDEQQTAQPVAQSLEKAMLENPSPLYRVMLAANAVQRVDDEHGLERSRRLLRKAAQANPDDPAYRVMLGQILRKQDNFDGAYQAYKQAAKPLNESPPMQWLRASGYQRQAIYQMGKVALTLAKRDQSEDREQWLSRAEEAMKKLEADSERRSGKAQLLRGKIELARDEPAKALAAFQRANEVYQDQNLEVLLGLAESAERLDQWGEAVDRIESVLSRRPDIIPIRLRLISILLERPIPANQKRAQQHLDLILSTKPDSKGALRLQARLYSQQGKFDKALTIYNDRLHLDRSPQLIGPRVRAYLADDQTDKARQLVRKQFEANPTNIGLVQQLLRLTDDKQEKLAILSRASKAGAEAGLINLFKQQVQGQKVAIDQVVNMIGQREDDPFAAALAEAKLYARAGKIDEARAALQRAIELNPDSPRIIEIRFRLALADQHYDKARKIIDQAARINIDQAHGKFYEARLFAARGQTPEAVATLRQALEARPVYSEGWRLLGSLLQRQNKHEQAIEALTKAIKQKPDDVEAIRRLAASQRVMGNNDEALQTIRDAWANAPGNNRVFDQYVSMEKAVGDPNRALEARSKRAEDKPTDEANRRALALLLAKQDRNDEAMSTIQDLIADQGRTRANIATLASVHRLRDQPEVGLKVIEDYLAQRGDQATVDDRVLKARYLGQIGRSDAMAQVYRQAMAKAGDAPQAVRREFAQRMFEQHKLDAARALYQQLHDANPDDLGITLRLAETMLRTGKNDQAKQLLESSREAEASVAGAVIRAMVARQDGDNDKALRLLNQSLGQTNSDNGGQSQASAGATKAARAMLRFQRGQILASQGKHEEAINEFRKTLELNSSLPRARMLLAESLIQTRRLDTAANELDQVLDKNPDNRQARLQLLNLYLSRGQKTPASNLLNDAVNRFPEEARWPRFQARLATQTGQTRMAEQAWRNALKLEPQPQVLSSLVRLLIEDDRPEEAVSLLNDHPEMTTSLPSLQALRGRALLASGQSSEGEQVFRRALERSQSPSQVSAVTGQIQAASKTPSQAASIMRSVPIASGPASAPRTQELTVALANSELAAGAYDQALKRLRRVRDQLAGDDQSMRRRIQRLIGMTLHESGQLAEARSAYQQILDQSPNDVRTLNNLAFLLSEGMNKPQEALPLARRASEQAPANVQVSDTLGWTQYKLGQLKQARQTLERTVRQQAIAPASYHLAVVLSEMAKQADDGTEREQLRRQARSTLRPILSGPGGLSNKTLRDDAQALLESLRAKSSSRSMEQTSP